MAILETSNGEKYQVNKNVLFTKDGILVDGVDISLLNKVTKKCKCVDNCKRNIESQTRTEYDFILHSGYFVNN
jgi:hypothetical protein